MKYSLGLDLGTTSIGWSVVNLDKNRIEDLGVRIFEKPETRTGESLSVPRRTARSARRRLHRRRQRLDYLKDFIINSGIIARADAEKALSPHRGQKNPYELRIKGLTKRLEPDELLIALYHIAKHRGYKSNSKRSVKGDKNDRKVKGAIKDNEKLLGDGQRTVAQVLVSRSNVAGHLRNKRDDYSNSFGRKDFEDEMCRLLNEQAKYYPQLTPDAIKRMMGIGDRRIGVFSQRPYITERLISKMRGTCPYEKDKPRIAKASYSYEVFRAAQKLVALRYSVRDTQTGAFDSGRSLTIDEIGRCLEKFKVTREPKYSQVREILGYKDNPNFSFDYIAGASAKDFKNDDERLKKEKSIAFTKMHFIYRVRKCVGDEIPTNNAQVAYDRVGEILSTKDADKVEDALRSDRNLSLSDKAIKSLAALADDCHGFGHLSREATVKITDKMIHGKKPVSYINAVRDAGYDNTDALHGELSRLPALSMREQKQITNPVVKRAVSQSIKVTNAIIKKHGLPYRVCIESARDLAKSPQERKKIDNAQKANAKSNKAIIGQIQEELRGNVAPSGKQILEYKLFKEQNDQCVYCGTSIEVDKLLGGDNYYQVDHIIPFSKCGNDSYTNKVLACAACNQQKSDKTPYQTWHSDIKRWREICKRVESNPKISKRKKERILTEEVNFDDGWNARALNDTRYAETYLANYIKKNLRFYEYGDENKKRVFTPTGAITSSLRKAWGVKAKVREENCLHHAVDATIIAATDNEAIARLEKFHKIHDNKYRYSYDKARKEYTDRETGEVYLPEMVLPWPDFAHELDKRSEPVDNTEESVKNWRDEFRNIYRDQDDSLKNNIHPIFVSRVPKRRGTGSVNDATIRSPKLKDGNKRLARIQLSDINIRDLDKSILVESDRKLYWRIKSRIIVEAVGKSAVLWLNNDRINANIKLKDYLKSFGNGLSHLAFERPLYKNGKVDEEFYRRNSIADIWLNHGEDKASSGHRDKNGRVLSPVGSVKVYGASPEPSGFVLKCKSRSVGFVNNGDMIRLDVYRKTDAGDKDKTRYYFVPVYAHQIKTGSKRILPVPKSGSKEIDDSFERVCQLYTNDYVRIDLGSGKLAEGYYITYDVSGATMKLRKHLSAGVNSDVRISPRSAASLARMDVNVLGDNYPWK